MFDRVTLARDLVDCRGAVLGRTGRVISPETIAEAASRAPPVAARLLSDTWVAEDLHLPLADAPYRHLFRGPGVQAAVARALLAVRLPPVLYDELLVVKASDALRYRHALTTAAVSARMLVAAVGEGRALPETTAAALLHDLGMRHLPAALARQPEGLAGEQGRQLAAHPLLGAYHLASVLGSHPAVEAALGHHWRQGQGYPHLPGPPSRTVEVVAVASAFAALTQPRPFRSEPFDARGAVDHLIAEAASGTADAGSVRLLVHALRGGQGDARALRFGRDRQGHAPAVNHHAPITAPARSAI